MTTRTRSLLVLPLLAALPLAATDTSFGGQVQVGLPTGTFGDGAHLDRKAGLGIGIQVPVDFGAGHVLRPRLDYLAFNRGNGGDSYKTGSLVALADYNYFPAEELSGAYFIAGLGLHSTRLEAVRTTNLVRNSASATSTGLAYNVGLGYAFNRNVAVEVKYLGMDMGSLTYTPAISDPRFMGNSVVGSVSFTF